MKNGLYLGVHLGHDRGAALVNGGELIGSISEERLDRVKHSSSPQIPKRSIAALLQEHGLDVTQICAASISYTNVRIADVIGDLADELRQHLSTPELKIFGADHHECHALSAFFTSGYEKADILIADGAGDIIGAQLEGESWYSADCATLILRDRRLQDFGSFRIDRRNSYSPRYMLEEDRGKAISLGRKYEQLTYLIGFTHGQSGKTMGLASYAQPLVRYQPQFNSDGPLDFRLSFETLLDDIDDAAEKSNLPWHQFVSDHAAKIAASAQMLVENYVIAVLNRIHTKSENRNLCLAGGLFLNCRMNHEILTRTPYHHIHIFPGAGDDGQAAGAAFHACLRDSSSPANKRLTHAYLGISHRESEIDDAIKYFGLYAKQFDDDWLTDIITDHLAEGRVVGILRGRSELGPRALGHRSILAMPQRLGVKDLLNRIKHRELFRPFAPMVISEAQFDYFKLEQESPFMLFATYLKDEFSGQLPGIVHIDGTSRVQAVDRQVEPFLHALLCKIKKRTRHPILLNTSFNLAGEPIVESPHDAIKTFLASEVDVLLLENRLIETKSVRRWA